MLLAALLTFLAKLHLARFKSRIVGVTGNAGKTGTRNAVAAVLASRYRVRTPAANMNTDLGMPAAIIGDFSRRYEREGGTPFFWLSVVIRGLWGWTAPRSSAPEVIVLEYGADKPGDIKRLAHRFPPDVAVVTQVGAVPVHVEFFASPRELAAEKAQLVKALLPTGHAVLNYDDLTVLDMRSASPAPDTTFGGGDGADVQYEQVRVRTDSRGAPLGVAFNITKGGATMPVTINGVLGRGIAAAGAAAAAVGAVLGIGLADAVQELARMRAPAGRMRILAGIKGTILVDDTYNSSPAAAHLAIDTVRDLPGRKVLVLGDMLELGNYSTAAHRELGTLAGTLASELVCVGERARFIAEGALNQLPKDCVHWFADSRAAAASVQALVKPGDVILVKGSQGMRMERVVLEVMAEPQKASELLARQSKRWLRK